MITVLGLDPGFASCGYAELNISDGQCEPIRMGVVQTKGSGKKRGILVVEDDTRRAKELSALLGMMIADSDIVCSESLSHGHSNATVGIKVGISWGVVVAHVQLNQRPLLQCSPAEIRKRLQLSGKASKNDLRDAMRVRYGANKCARLLESTAEGSQVHAYDALAAATACLDSDQVRLMLVSRK